MTAKVKKCKTALVTGILALLALLLPAAPALADYCYSDDPDKVPPFLTPGVDPNMLMIIDNSASMYDLAYVHDPRYCYDETYDTDQIYTGYFTVDGWYRYDFDSERFVAAAPEAGCTEANYRKGLVGSREICLEISTGVDIDGDPVVTLESFAARGNYLNWTAASKMDIEKEILTGGKYEDDALVMESRGCLEKRFVKQTTISPAGSDGSGSHHLAVAVRPPTPMEQLTNPDDHTTRIEIFPVNDSDGAYDHEACQNAVEEMRKDSPNLGALKGYIDDCFDYRSGTAGDHTVASQAALNHAIQTCWFIVKHDDPGSITVGDINRSINACEQIYEGNGPPGIDPKDITTDHMGYMCFGNYNAKRLGHGGDHPVHVSGYIGYCWDHSAVTWRPNDKIQNDGWSANTYDSVNACVKDGLLRYCGVIDVPPVTDPSDQVTGVGDDTGEFWNLPAVLVDSGVISQIGHPIAVLQGRLATPEAPSGLLQEFANDLRMGAMVFNRDGAAYECTLSDTLYACDDNVRDGGRVIQPVGQGEAHTASLVAAVNAIVADTWTPLAETMYNAIGYYLQDENMRLHEDDFSIGPGHAPITAWCQPNNILLITDGAPTADLNPQMVNFASSLNYNLGSGTCDALHGSTWLDDLARYAYSGLAEDESLNFAAPDSIAEEEYRPIFTHVVAVGDFRDDDADKCSPHNLLAETAESGGTKLYQAVNLSELETYLREAFRNIRAGAAAGSAASVISATRSGEGAVYQAIFWPDKFDNLDNEINWAGEVQALLVDTHGKLYEDSNQNRLLDPCADPNDDSGDCDRPVTVFHHPGAGTSMACLGVWDEESNSCAGDVREISDVNYLWSANDWLTTVSGGSITGNRNDYLHKDRSRYIFTWHDGNNDGIVQSTEILPFEADEITNLGAAVYQDFGVNTEAEAANVINWIRGLDQAGLRSRQIMHNGELATWRLGDVVHSTPTVVARPAEGYHFLYRDSSYARFVNRHTNRRHMIYFGGNDGMLHAVNGGFFEPGQNKFCLTPDCTGEEGDQAIPLGAEMWAYVPYNLWPHLKCLTDPDYGHKYYVDLVPRIFDVQIFEDQDENIYTDGWGTILVGGMRFGGETVELNGKTFSSAFFILDITDPEKPPRLLAEMTFSQDDLMAMGFTTAVPTVVPMVQGDTSEWYLVLGSGPTNVKGESDQHGSIGVISLGELVHSSNPVPFRIPDTPPGDTFDQQTGSFTLPDANSSVSELITADFGLNYLANAVYFGTVSGNFNDGWGGKMYRLVTDSRDPEGNQELTTPDQWPTLLDTEPNPVALIDVGQPVTAGASISFDYYNYWVYFGTGRLYNSDDYNDDDIFHYYGIKEPRNCSVAGSFTWETVANQDYLSTNPDLNTAIPGNRGLLRVDQIEVQANRLASAAGLECSDDSDCLPSEVEYFAQLQDYIAGFGCTAPLAEQGVDGWYRKFHREGERNLGQATILGGLLTYSAYLPNEDICNPEGTSDLYALYFQTGTAWHRSIFGRTLEEGEWVDYRVLVGPGLATTPSLHVGADTGAKAFLQTSTGAIISIDQPELPFEDHRPGRAWWRELYRNILTD
ncbi:pilus assembly protein [Desulfurivibrio alkaliphilus]|uniref:Tfp pilus assembly protein tip-associated adhesin PilY1-like protein n=1 Tax=Desulfurivibrio alkaliphilus (strain DSM 19089 / UNIQEM U267 / AHT2) TaxID=589865 RepID=D6Z6V6_DESAT|nr:PilC/PilY family type IV pilus protein [Desulfurivibrio alkaliphilus]ADH86943.1 Tfp pilus assembly protein tip-associated adhesin PilY1-like protein [Desulfurivibrio alkaliphilus AHT 2]